MLITRTSTYTGVERTREIAITPVQLKAWESGELIQRVAPYLSEDDREFILTGIVSEEWDSLFGDYDEDTDTTVDDDKAF